jgi:hypothetical protein
MRALVLALPALTLALSSGAEAEQRTGQQLYGKCCVSVWGEALARDQIGLIAEHLYAIQHPPAGAGR